MEIVNRHGVLSRPATTFRGVNPTGISSRTWLGRLAGASRSDSVVHPVVSGLIRVTSVMVVRLRGVAIVIVASAFGCILASVTV